MLLKLLPLIAVARRAPKEHVLQRCAMPVSPGSLVARADAIDHFHRDLVARARGQGAARPLASRKLSTPSITSPARRPPGRGGRRRGVRGPRWTPMSASAPRKASRSKQGRGLLTFATQDVHRLFIGHAIQLALDHLALDRSGMVVQQAILQVVKPCRSARA